MPPSALPSSLIKETLEFMGVSTKGPEEDGQKIRLRIGGWDAKRVQFKGCVLVERFSYRVVEGAFCVFARDAVGFLSFFLSFFEMLDAMGGEGGLPVSPTNWFFTSVDLVSSLVWKDGGWFCLRYFCELDP
ncbi:hypothetical protein BDQ17DRAFT_1429729 [Cyathus striatus]|nr:hypothetical protein BDQ17DRAFT_1429729 [Cyathus striatus]